MEPFIHDTQARQKSMPIGNSQLSKTGYESCLLYYTVTSIEEKVNKAWPKYRVKYI